jgi:hypothetical protein
MEGKDFNVIANSRGYQVQYKGHNIGGAGISGAAKGPTGRQANKQVQDYLKYGNMDIDAILAGHGRPDMVAEVNKIDSIKYNDNISIIEVTREPRTLQQNEYYAVMVTDPFNKQSRSREDYFDYDKNWIGLECTGSNQVYISKDFTERHDSYRGVTVIVVVVDKSQCYEL